MVRVCNLCLKKLAKVEDDDDDDRRSVASSVTNFPAHQLGMDPFTSFPHPQSPFAASQLFGQASEPFNLYSIAETRKPMYGSDGSLSRPLTPMDGEDGVWESSVRDNPAPFRRGLYDEEKDTANISSNFTPENSTLGTEIKTNIELPVASKPVLIEQSTSSIQFPLGSPEHLGSPLRLSNKVRPGNPYGEIEVATPFIRSRVQSRLDSAISEVEPSWRMRRESTAYVYKL